MLKFYDDANMEGDTGSNNFFVSSIKNASPMHSHDFFEFFLITGGMTQHLVNGKKQILSEGALVFIRPEDIHSYDYYEGRDCSFINICYSKNMINDAMNFLGEAFEKERLLTSLLPPYVVLLPAEMENLKSRIDRQNAFPSENRRKSRIQAAGLLVDILVQYFSGVDTSRNRSVPLWLEALLIKFQNTDNIKFGLSRMYELCQRTPGHLNRAFRQYLGTTPTAYINNLKLQYARNLLITTKLSIIEISLEAGFENLSHFYHLFKKNFNVTPLAFREMSKGNVKIVSHKICEPLGRTPE